MIIGLCGLSGSGKSVTADYLVNKYDFIEISFGAVLKDVMAAMFGWDRKMLDGKTKEDRIRRTTKDEYWSKKFNRDVIPKEELKFFGANIIRYEYLEDFWLNATELKIQKNSERNIVISDMRFNNEYFYIKNLSKSFIVQIIQEYSLPEWALDACKASDFAHHGFKNYTEDEIVSARLNLKEKDIHESEYTHFGFEKDEIIGNNDSLEKLYKKIDKFIEKNNIHLKNGNHNFLENKLEN